jgi:hypothetical protein
VREYRVLSGLRADPAPAFSRPSHVFLVRRSEILGAAFFLVELLGVVARDAQAVWA